jgi:hypothetical protein
VRPCLEASHCKPTLAAGTARSWAERPLIGHLADVVMVSPGLNLRAPALTVGAAQLGGAQRTAE